MSPLDEFFAAAPHDLRWVVEIREPSWLHENVYEVLERHGAALCVHDMLPDHPWVVTSDWLYLRFHGPQATPHKYGGRRLWRTAGRPGEHLHERHDVYAYFYNDFNGDAVQDARWLAARLAAPESASV